MSDGRLDGRLINDNKLQEYQQNKRKMAWISTKAAFHRYLMGGGGITPPKKIKNSRKSTSETSQF